MNFTAAAAAITVYVVTAFCCSTVKGVDDAGLVFSRGYVCITRPQDFAFVIPQQKSIVLETEDLGELNLLGSSTIQSGGIYDPADVQIVDRLGTSEADNFAGEINTFLGTGGDPTPVFCTQDSDCFTKACVVRFNVCTTRASCQKADCNSDEICFKGPDFCVDKKDLEPEQGPRGQFAGQRQPKFIPQKDPGFFFHGECVATQVAGPQILGRSCLLNLCLGGGGYNCLAIYAGSKFVFNPLEQVLVSPTTFSGVLDITGGLPELVLNLNNPGSIVPSLPPSYPGTIIGGTGLFVGAVGYVDVTTITGSTLPPLQFPPKSISQPGSSPNISADLPQAGYITQKISVVTNVPLPVAP